MGFESPRRLYGLVAQMGERRFCKPDVTGSIPVESTDSYSGAISSSDEAIASEFRRICPIESIPLRSAGDAFSA